MFIYPDFVIIKIYSLTIQQCMPTCAVAEGGMLIFGDEVGNIIFADRDFNVSEKRTKIYKGAVRGLTYLLDPQKTNNNTAYLFTLGEDHRPGETPIYSIKVFLASDLSRPITVLNASSTSNSNDTITAFAVLHDGNEIAVGYNSGRTVVFCGQFINKDATQARHTTSSIYNPIVLLEKHPYSVAALHFSDTTTTSNTSSTSSVEDRYVRLFVTMDTKDNLTTSTTTANTPEDAMLLHGAGMDFDEEDISNAGIIIFDTSYRITTSSTTSTTKVIYNAARIPKALDNRGGSRLCSSYIRSSNELIIAREEAVCSYTVEDRGGAMYILGNC
jgi:hypothetical protein